MHSLMLQDLLAASALPKSAGMRRRGALLLRALPSSQQDAISLPQCDALVPRAADVLWDEHEIVTVPSTVPNRVAAE